MELQKMVFKFLEQVEIYKGRVDMDKLFTALMQHITEEDWLALVLKTDKGKIVGTLLAFFTDDILREPFVAERLFYVDPDHRNSGAAKELISVMEAWGVSKGATVASIHNHEAPRLEALNRAYRMMGYHPVEHTFRKEI